MGSPTNRRQQQQHRNSSVNGGNGYHN